MNNFETMVVIVILIISFAMGFCLNSTYLSLPSTIKEKIKTDTKHNYRTSSAQMEYIINEYYKDK